jgi:hypothetical protein
VLGEQGKLDEAIAVLKSGPASDGDAGKEDAEVQLRLAEKLRQQRRNDEAAAIIEKLLAREPTAAAYNSLGLVRMSQGRLADAIAAYRQGLELRPDFAEVRNNMAVAMELHRAPDGGVSELETALMIRPDFNVAHLNRAVSWLRQGDFDRGWLEFEWRWLCDGHRLQKMSAPRWLGQAIPEKTILLHSEQGLGDTLQFIRYALLVRERCGRLIVQCHKPLQKLLAQCPGIDELVAGDAPLPEHHAQLPMMSLPRVFGTQVEDVPRDVRYVFADAALIETWRQRLAGIEGFRVGIAWQGNTVYAGDAFRSLPLRHFAPLAGVSGVRLVSLQKGFGAEQVRGLAQSFPIVDLGPDVDEAAGAFMDTAAIMKNLDLVISSDTAMVHLAGALGVPVWVALGHTSDWRWLEEREDCPWYPTMRLFRQKRLGDWDGLFADIAAELAGVVRGEWPVTMPVNPATSISPAAPAPLHAPLSVGELLDRITILTLKQARIPAAGARENIERELRELTAIRRQFVPCDAEFAALADELAAVNTELWEIEDEIRGCEVRGDFGPRFIELARSVYRTNDRRSAIKRRINEAAGSAIVEEKHYSAGART